MFWQRVTYTFLSFCVMTLMLNTTPTLLKAFLTSWKCRFFGMISLIFSKASFSSSVELGSAVWTAKVRFNSSHKNLNQVKLTTYNIYRIHYRSGNKNLSKNIELSSPVETKPSVPPLSDVIYKRDVLPWFNYVFAFNTLRQF